MAGTVEIIGKRWEEGVIAVEVLMTGGSYAFGPVDSSSIQADWEHLLFMWMVVTA